MAPLWGESHYVIRPKREDIMDVESWLCTIAQAEDDLGPYLNLWIDDPSLSASFALSALLLSGRDIDSGKSNRNAFWSDREVQYVQVRTWAGSAHVVQRLQVARAETDDPKSADEFDAALGILSSGVGEPALYN